MTTKEDIKRWFDEGRKKGAVWLIVACDTFDHSDYPIYVYPDGDHAPEGHIHREVEKAESQSMTRVMEVYHLHRDRDSQLDQHRCRADVGAEMAPAPSEIQPQVKIDDSPLIGYGEISDIAIRVAHQISGEASSYPPDLLEVSALSVARIARGPKVSYSEQHESWVRDLIERGWSSGDEIDSELKTHPYILPWSDLPEIARRKSIAWLGTVEALLAARNPDAAEQERLSEVEEPSFESLDETVHDPMSYHDMSKPFADKRSLLQAASAFKNGLQEIRKKARVKDVSYVIELDVLGSSGPEAYQFAGHLGDVDKAEVLHAVGMMTARQGRKERIARIIGMGQKSIEDLIAES